MTDEQWDEFARAFPEVAVVNWTEEAMQAMADEYQRAAIADAQSEAAWIAHEKEARRG